MTTIMPKAPRYAATRFLLGAAIAAAAALPAGAQARQQDSTFRWTGRVADGAWVNVRNLNGSIRVQPGTGSDVEVRATKSWRRGNPESVRIRVTRYGPGDRDVLVCALWGENSTCTEDNLRTRGEPRSRGNDNNDTSVDFVIIVPRATNVQAASVNGSVAVTGTTGRIKANSVNGNVRAESTGGPVEANAVNGNVTARMGAMGSDDLAYASVNGNVLVEFTGALDAEIEMSTVNGGFETNVPLTLHGRINPRHIRATIGRGGRSIKLSTVNGNVELRRN